MRVFSFDWATKKALTVYDSQTEKIKQIPNSIEEFEKFLEKTKEPAIMLFEFGGGDTFKIMAFRAGHTVLQVPGKAIHDYRDEQGLEKSDEADAKAIYAFYIKEGGGVGIILSKGIVKKMPSADEKNGGGAGMAISKRTRVYLPAPLLSLHRTGRRDCGD